MVIVAAENQTAIAGALERAGAILLLGTHDMLTPESVTEGILSLANDAQARVEMSESAAAICDGAGASRVVEQLTL